MIKYCKYVIFFDIFVVVKYVLIDEKLGIVELKEFNGKKRVWDIKYDWCLFNWLG